ncbi:MAG TPA: amidohydrolase family protein [Gemmatimonadales bacterium]|nr:amidohydrolase family protein [Gemmatimonadales bacterium]
MRAFLAGLLLVAAAGTAGAQGATGIQSGLRPGRFVIRNAMVIVGNGTPAAGPYDLVIEGSTITGMVPLDPVAVKSGQARRPAATAEIDATGKYVMPGLINAHGHVQDSRGGIPQPLDYELKLWLASGVTTVRDVGSDTRKTIQLRAASAAGTVAAPRILVYAMFGGGGDAVDSRGINTPAEARARVRELKALGVDGIKIVGIDRDLMQAMEEEAHAVGLPIAHHAGVEETNAWDDIKFGTRSIEHWYGVPDAALADGGQHFPSSYNYQNEIDRFRWAGRLWREADPERLGRVLQGMVDANVAWVPTLVIYEASRDLTRAQNQPWFKDYLHPTLEEYFKPNPANHGSYFIGWSSTDEAYWRENYRIWMAALRDFERRGGIIGVGEDAGFIYQMYGFALIRELELQQEAGFSALKVLQHVAQNNARILGMEDRIGRVRPGYLADLVVINGNPLEDLKVLYPTGTTAIVNGKEAPAGGIEWTIKDGIPYHVPTLMRELKAMVAGARHK